MNYGLFRDMAKMEKEGNFAELISLSMNIMSDKEYMDLYNIVSNNLLRINNKIESLIYEFWVEPRVIYETKYNPRNYSSDINGKYLNELPVVVSLTTISGRLDRLKRTIESILNQSLDLHSINLYISKEPFLLDAGIDEECQELKDLYDLGVNIYSVPNIGPYRKQIPVIYQLQNNKAPLQTPIVTIDDDVIYPDNIIENLLKVKNSVVAHRGRQMVLNADGISNYNDFRIPKSNKDFLNLGTGKNGILYRLGFFPNNPKGYVGPIIAPTADDLWCKWITAYACIPTYILEPEAAYKPELDFEESDPLDKNGLFHQFNKQSKSGKGNNDTAIEALENYYLYNFGQNLFSIYSYKK